MSEHYDKWRVGHPAANQTRCPGCRAPVIRTSVTGEQCVHKTDCAYMEWLADQLDTIDIEEAAPEIECSCDKHGLYSPGSVESMRSGETDPWCEEHGVEDVRSGAYKSWSPEERRRFDRRLSSALI